MSKFNAHQQVMILSLTAFLATGFKGTQAQLQKFTKKRLDIILSRDLPGWEVVWGPAVWTHDLDNDHAGPDHVSFVVKHPSLEFPDGERRETYVLSIAGTQTNYNEVVNNNLVHSVVDFKEWVERGIATDPKPADPTQISPENCYISRGTAIGVHRLVTITPSSPAASPGVNIRDYLDTLPKSPDARMILAGHSLGAPLASTMALALSMSKTFDKAFSPSNILVYPTAGPAIGNPKFAQLYDNTFPRVPALPVNDGYKTWNCMIVNLRDPVSQAWCAFKELSPEQNLSNIPTIFGEPAPKDVLEGVMVMTFNAKRSKVTYFPIQAVYFDGNAPEVRPTDMKSFLKEKSRQHTAQILEWMDGIKTEYEIAVDDDDEVQKVSKEEEERQEPFSCELLAHYGIEVLDADKELCAILRKKNSTQ